MGVLDFKVWRTQCHLAAIAVVLALEKHQHSIAKNLRGRGLRGVHVHVHIIFMSFGSIGVCRGDGDAENNNIT